ncbi:hypothetical protein VNO77_04360 [Canavalia gladiata]|uniref:Uncharacterized protein n=1 Tax=Canavalia gladiata TaxID=3824 RepID=A0AAN9MWD6_CANGL
MRVRGSRGQKSFSCGYVNDNDDDLGESLKLRPWRREEKSTSYAFGGRKPLSLVMVIVMATKRIRSNFQIGFDGFSFEFAKKKMCDNEGEEDLDERAQVNSGKRNEESMLVEASMDDVFEKERILKKREGHASWKSWPSLIDACKEGDPFLCTRNILETFRPTTAA